MFEATKTSDISSAQDKLLTCKQVAELTGIPERSVRKLFDTRAIELIKFNRRLYVRKSTLSEYLAANTLPSRKGV
ncbi:helix-turn-helix domain-containing protein [Propionimicrobium lymphophilum]|uniref:helix-turn-helix domain-containing protein n=1 Tax=Propionimicrobium lymphophilum TaxID=33012 RepID=UPI0035D077B8